MSLYSNQVKLFLAHGLLLFQDTDLASSRDEVMSLKRKLESQQVEQAETFNKLTKSLEQSQTQCKQLLEQGLN